MSLKLLKSYRFVDKDPVIDKMRGPIKQSELSYAEISAKSGVSVSTIYNWFDGATKRPQYATVVAVMRVLGYKELFVKPQSAVPKGKRHANANGNKVGFAESGGDG